MIESPYDSAEEEDLYETYYWEPSTDPTVELYESMLEADWVDEPLRDLLETRVEAVR